MTGYELNFQQGTRAGADRRSWHRQDFVAGMSYPYSVSLQETAVSFKARAPTDVPLIWLRLL